MMWSWTWPVIVTLNFRWDHHVRLLAQRSFSTKVTVQTRTHIHRRKRPMYPWDAYPPTLKNERTKCIGPLQLLWLDVTFCWAWRLITDVHHRSCQNCGQPSTKQALAARLRRDQAGSLWRFPRPASWIEGDGKEEYGKYDWNRDGS